MGPKRGTEVVLTSLDPSHLYASLGAHQWSGSSALDCPPNYFFEILHKARFYILVLFGIIYLGEQCKLKFWRGSRRLCCCK